MKKIILLGGIFLLFLACDGVNDHSSESKDKFIRHTVAFKLKHPKGSPEEKVFLDEINKLSSIPVVKNFECLLQTGKKNNFDYGVSMEFDSMEAYEEYNQHPDHVAFVQTYWIPNVEDYLEIDYEPFK